MQLASLIATLTFLMSGSITMAAEYLPPPLFGSTSRSAPMTVKTTSPLTKSDTQDGKLLTSPSVKPPLPVQKPAISTTLLTVKNNIKKKSEPIDIIEKSTVKKSVVKGPKTMPAVQKETVHKEVTFVPAPHNSEESLIQRAQGNLTAENKVNSLAAEPSAFNLTHNKFAILLTNQELLTKQVQDMLQYLKQHPETSAYMRSYSQQGGKESLKHAMDIRSEVLKSGIEPYRIHIIAQKDLGMIEAPERIEIELK